LKGGSRQTSPVNGAEDRTPPGRFACWAAPLTGLVCLGRSFTAGRTRAAGSTPNLSPDPPLLRGRVRETRWVARPVGAAAGIREARRPLQPVSPEAFMQSFNPVVFALRRPITVMAGVAALAVACLLSLTRMPIDVFPTLDLPVIVVAQPYG